MTNVQTTPEVAQPGRHALPALPGCGQPATARIEAFSPASNGEAGGSLDASVYTCDSHAAAAVATLQAVAFNAYRVAGGDGVKRCGDGMDFTGDRTVPLAAPAATREPAAVVSAAAAGQPALTRIARTNMLRAISRECFAVDKDALPAPEAVAFVPHDGGGHAVDLEFNTVAEAEAWAIALKATRDARITVNRDMSGTLYRGYRAEGTWRGFEVTVAAVERATEAAEGTAAVGPVKAANLSATRSATALAAEGERLHSALSEIAGMCSCGSDEDCPSTLARRALGTETGR